MIQFYYLYNYAAFSLVINSQPTSLLVDSESNETSCQHFYKGTLQMHLKSNHFKRIGLHHSINYYIIRILNFTDLYLQYMGQLLLHWASEDTFLPPHILPSHPIVAASWPCLPSCTWCLLPPVQHGPVWNGPQWSVGDGIHSRRPNLTPDSLESKHI